MAISKSLSVLGILFFLANFVSPKALAAEDVNWSVERTVGNLEQLSERVPFSTLTFRGTVANDEIRIKLLNLARQLFPLQTIADNMVVADGGIELSEASFALEQLRRLGSGIIEIKQNLVSIHGIAKNGVDVTASEKGIRNALPQNLKLADVVIEPSTAKTFSWSAVKQGSTVRLDGFVPSPDVKEVIASDAKLRFPDFTINDHTVIAKGAPEDFLSAAKVGLNQLENLSSGNVNVSGLDYKIDSSTPTKPGISSKEFADALKNTASNALPESFNSPKVTISKQTLVQDDRSVDILFATDRTRHDDGFEVNFDFHRQDALNYGIARIHIPEGHGIGKIELPYEGFTLFKFTIFKQSADPTKHFQIDQIEVMDRDSWGKIATQSGKEALIFVHGYNTSFQASLYRAAQITWDLQYKNTSILFSWPSRGDLLSYEWDRNSALFARSHFIEMLTYLHDELGIQTVNVLAHSMGNFVVIDALSQYGDSSVPPPISQLIMAAPDIDRDEYLQSIPRIAKVIGGMTLYASAADRAIQTSRTLAQAPRAGDIIDGKPALAKNVDAIDVTAIGSELFGLNHDVFASSRSIISDLGRLLSGQRPPNQRTVEIRTVPEGASVPLFWRYAP